MEKESKEICFIMCVNHDKYEQEAMYYIQNLLIPDGYKIDVISVKDANSITEGYNAAMMSSNAKYKIYMHQDVFIVNKKLLENMLTIFKDNTIGMIGMVGCKKLSSHGIMWHSKRVGKLYGSIPRCSGKGTYGEIEGKFEDVEAIDGFLMITQYDIPWREDLFDGWDFYDISQSMEMRKKGYRIVVPNQSEPWCIHDDGYLNFENYYYYRKIFEKEYFS